MLVNLYVKKLEKQVKNNSNCMKRTNKIKGTLERPRLSVFRSNCHIYAQVIDDSSGMTIVSTSTLDKDVKSLLTNTSTCEASKIVGQVIAQKTLARNIKQVIFDRGKRVYHGRISALAEAARESGLEF